MILLIRHAEKLLTGEQDLTVKGLGDALIFGKKLKKQGINFYKIVTSPVNRCVQTAESIVEGLETDIYIEKSHLLGNPGIFVSDEKKAMEIFEKFSVCEVINSMISKKRLAGFLPVDEACKPLIDEIEENIDRNHSILYVSHDAIVAPFCAYITGVNRIVKSEIVEYLDGYIIEKSHNKALHLTAFPLRSIAAGGLGC